MIKKGIRIEKHTSLRREQLRAELPRVGKAVHINWAFCQRFPKGKRGDKRKRGPVSGLEGGTNFESAGGKKRKFRRVFRGEGWDFIVKSQIISIGGRDDIEKKVRVGSETHVGSLHIREVVAEIWPRTRENNLGIEMKVGKGEGEGPKSCMGKFPREENARKRSPPFSGN